MNKLKRAWLNFRRKKINAEETLSGSVEATDDRLPRSAGYIGGVTPAVGPISPLGNLEPNSTSLVSGTSSAVAEDFPSLDTGGTGVVHPELETLDEKRAEIDRELGLPPDAPADTGAALDKDVADHAGSIERWEKEDEEQGRKA